MSAYHVQKRSVYRALAAMLSNDLTAGAGYIEEDDAGEPLDEFALRRRKKAAEAILRELRKKGREGL